jgi:protein ImuB
VRRIACIALPEIRLEIAQEREENRQDARDAREKENGSASDSSWRSSCPGGSPLLAVVVTRRGSAVKTERDVLGNTRLDVVSRAARAAGIRAGQTVAAARAKHAELRVRVVEENAVRGALARLAEVALAFGPAVSFDVAEDVVWVDVTGCAHLHGGELPLARALGARVRALGHTCRVAVADGPRIASAVARFRVKTDEGPARSKRADPNADVGPARSKRADPNADVGPLVVPPGKGAAAMRGLPIAALALDPDVTRWLVDLGLPRCGDLQRLPRKSFGTRLGARTHDVMRLLDGEDRAPLDAWRPPTVLEECIELEWGARSVEALAFVVKTLCDRLAARLQGRAVAAARLELELALDRALCNGADPVSRLRVTLPSPLARAADLLAVLRARLERHTLAAPALAVTLRAPELAGASPRTLSLLEPEPKADRALPRLVAELSAELGAARVGVLALVDTWAPGERTRLVAPTAPLPSFRHPLVRSALEPSRLVEPSRRPLEALSEVRMLARVEAVEWWRRGPARRDVAAAWTRSEHGGALAWVELHEDDAVVRGWVD